MPSMERHASRRRPKLLERQHSWHAFDADGLHEGVEFETLSHAGMSEQEERALKQQGAGTSSGASPPCCMDVLGRTSVVATLMPHPRASMGRLSRVHEYSFADMAGDTVRRKIVKKQPAAHGGRRSMFGGGGGGHGGGGGSGVLDGVAAASKARAAYQRPSPSSPGSPGSPGELAGVTRSRTWRQRFRRSEEGDVSPSLWSSGTFKRMASFTSRGAEKPLEPPRCLIDPRTSRVLGPLDTLNLLALAFTALVTPWEVAFLTPPGYVDWLFVTNRLVDVVFLVDIFVQFNLMYPAAGDTRWRRNYVTSRRLIARRYICSWFFMIDVFSTGLSVVDLIPFVTSEGHSSSCDGDSALTQLKVLRTVRVLRLTKLLRLMRASRLLARWETKVAINYAMLSLVRITLAVLLYLHWSACLWAVQTSMQSDLSLSWLAVRHYCVRVGQEQPGVEYPEQPPPGVGHCGEEWVCRTVSSTYLCALYVVSSVSTIIASDGNWYEQVTAVFLMLIGGTLWASVTGVFCRVVSESNPTLTEFRMTMDNLNSYMRQRRLPHELQWRLREYFHKTRHLIHSAATNRLLEKMSPSLQGEVLWLTNSSWLRRIRFLRGCEPEFIARVLLSLRPLIFAPGDVAFGNSLYVLHRGVAIHGGRVLGSGGVWGEDMLLCNPRLRLRVYARALNYVEAFSIDRETLMEVGSHFPDTTLRIRSYIGLLALRRAIVLIATEEREHRKQLGLGPDERSPYLVQFFAECDERTYRSRLDAPGRSLNALGGLAAPRRPSDALPVVEAPPKLFGSGALGRDISKPLPSAKASEGALKAPEQEPRAPEQVPMPRASRTPTPPPKPSGTGTASPASTPSPTSVSNPPPSVDAARASPGPVEGSVEAGGPSGDRPQQKIRRRRRQASPEREQQDAPRSQPQSRIGAITSAIGELRTEMLEQRAMLQTIIAGMAPAFDASQGGLSPAAGRTRSRKSPSRSQGGSSKGCRDLSETIDMELARADDSLAAWRASEQRLLAQISKPQQGVVPRGPFDA